MASLESHPSGIYALTGVMSASIPKPDAPPRVRLFI